MTTLRAWASFPITGMGIYRIDRRVFLEATNR